MPINVIVALIRVTKTDHSPDTMKFSDNSLTFSLTICGTPDRFNWYSYHACTTSVKGNDQTVKLIFNDNNFIMITP